MSELTNLDICNEAIASKKTTEMNFILLGKYLAEIRDGRLYEGQWQTFPVFLEEINITESMASKMINIYKTFIVDYKIEPVKLVEAGGWSKLAMTLSHIENKQDALHWIEKSSLLTTSDLSREIKEKKTGVEMKKCKHKNTYTIRVCRDCGDREHLGD